VDHNTLENFIYYLYMDRIPPTKSTGPENTISEDDLAPVRNLMEFGKREQLPHLVYLCDKKIFENNPTKLKTLPCASTLQSDMAVLVNNRKFSDAVFKLTFEQRQHSLGDKIENVGEYIYANKYILSAHNDYFKAMFDPAKNLRESHSSAKVNLGYHGLVLLDVFSYIYAQAPPTRTLNTLFATDLLEASNQFMIKHLGLFAQFFLIEHMDVTNVCSLLMLADLHHASFLKEECVDFIIRYFTEMEETEEYETLNTSLKDEITRISHRKI